MWQHTIIITQREKGKDRLIDVFHKDEPNVILKLLDGVSDCFIF